MRLLFVSSRSASVLLSEAGDYLLDRPVRYMLNDGKAKECRRTMLSLYDLRPDEEYRLRTVSTDGGTEEEISFRTAAESASLDVRRFGAKGDGITDDTAAIQAAVLSCPDNGRVMIPAGTYRTGPIFLKSRMTMEIKDGARLALETDRSRFPILPGVTFAGEDEYLLGQEEGNPLDCFASALTGIHVEDVRIIGTGTVDGRAPEGDWWEDPKCRRGAWRPRLLFLRRCRNVTVQGLTFLNSPCWNLHPVESESLLFCDLKIEAPAVSPNTDGLDPESCKGVRIYGVRFSVGDDCIAIKSGKIYMGRKYAIPCEDLEIAWCAMLDGHGGVTVGSEMSGGVRDLRVHHCRMYGNDRGIRLKTRRGRGRKGVLDNMVFQDLRMDRVKVPLVVNCLYYCDPDGHTEYVQSRKPIAVDDGTPTVGSLLLERIEAVNCEACAGYILGLPENPVRSVLIRDCRFTFSPEAKAMAPAMAEGVEPVSRRGVIALFTSEIRLERVRMEGVEGPELEQPENGDESKGCPPAGN